MNRGRSAITIVVSIAIILLGLFLLYQKKPYDPNAAIDVTGGNQYCQPEPITANTPSVQLPAYVVDCGKDKDEGECKNICVVDGKQGKGCGTAGANVMHTYKRIKTNVPIWGRYFHGFSCQPYVEDAGGYIDENQQCEVIAPNIKDVQHFGSGSYSTVTINGKQYEVWYPNAESANNSVRFIGKDGKQVESIKFHEYGLIVLVHLTDGPSKSYLTKNREFKDISGTIKNAKPTDKERYWIVDIYKDVSTGDKYQKKDLPADILQCQDASLAGGGSITPVQSSVVYPPQNKSPDQKQLQLEYFLFNKPGIPNPISWWTPECKPAIYLYPEQETQVRVTLAPKGMLTYTDPAYPQSGWDVTAYPDGTLVENGKKYPYLYYESKIHDELIKKPTTGFVVSFLELQTLYKSILPQLGLNEVEANDFVEYWTKALAYSPYYFVGIMDQENINQIEPLKISPAPDSINRVRVYFEALQLPKKVEPPVFRLEVQKGFRVVEWGGMVKVDKTHPFTCSQ